MQHNVVTSFISDIYDGAPLMKSTDLGGEVLADSLIKVSQFHRCSTISDIGKELRALAEYLISFFMANFLEYGSSYHTHLNKQLINSVFLCWIYIFGLFAKEADVLHFPEVVVEIIIVANNVSVWNFKAAVVWDVGAVASTLLAKGSHSQ